MLRSSFAPELDNIEGNSLPVYPPLSRNTAYFSFAKCKEVLQRKNLGFFADCAAKKWPFGQPVPRAVCEKARSAFSRQPSASNQHSATHGTELLRYFGM